MGNFKRDRKSGGDRFGGRDRGFGGRDRGFGGGRDRDRGPAEMHQAVCDGCGNDCEVPFRPTSGKPVYCNDCFKKSDSRSGRDARGSRDGGGRDSGQNNKQLTEALVGLNHKLDQIIGLLSAKAKVDTKEIPVKVLEEKEKSSVKKTKKVAKKETTPKKTVKKVAAKKKK